MLVERVERRTARDRRERCSLGPREIPHRYMVGDTGCRMLCICVPAGFEGLVREMSEPDGSRTLPPASEGPPDMERIAAIARAHGCELLA